MITQTLDGDLGMSESLGGRTEQKISEIMGEIGRSRIVGRVKGEKR